MKIRYQVGSIDELRCGDPLRFIFNVFILKLDHLVQKLLYLSAINFGVYYLRNFVLRFLVNYNWCES